jgi:hypothetical protein
MKKQVLLLCLIGMLTGAVSVFADHPNDQVGVGLFLGGGSGTVGGGLFHPGLTLKFPDMPVFWGVNASFGAATGLGVSADYYFFDRDLVKDGSVDLDWFLGLGGFGHLYFGDIFYIALGARLPVGLSWHINKTFELYLDVAPGIGARFTPEPLYWTAGAELGLRVWL